MRKGAKKRGSKATTASGSSIDEGMVDSAEAKTQETQPIVKDEEKEEEAKVNEEQGVKVESPIVMVIVKEGENEEEAKPDSSTQQENRGSKNEEATGASSSSSQPLVEVKKEERNRSTEVLSSAKPQSEPEYLEEMPSLTESSIPLSDKTWVQSEDADIVPMKDMKRAWVPYIPFKEDESEQSTVVLVHITFPSEPRVACEYDWAVGNLEAVQLMVQQAMQYIDQTPDLEIRIGLIKTVNNVSAGKIYVEIGRARLTNKEEQGLIAEAADFMQHVAVHIDGDDSSGLRGCSGDGGHDDDKRENYGNRGQSNDADGGGSDDSDDSSDDILENNHNPIVIWWDLENSGVPYDFVKTAGDGDKGEILYQRFVGKLEEKGYFGQVTIKIVVGYRNHKVPHYLRNHHRFTIHVAKNFNRPRRGSKNDQSADEEIKRQIDNWLKQRPEPHVVMIVTGDNGFADSFEKLGNYNHVTIVVRTVKRNSRRTSVEVSQAAGTAWELREFLNLPKKCVSKKLRRLRWFLQKKKRNSKASIRVKKVKIAALK